MGGIFGPIGSALGIDASDEAYNGVQMQDVNQGNLWGQEQQTAANNYGTQANQDRDHQMAFVQALQAQMNGSGPSVANTMLNQNTAQAMNNANAMAAAQRGVNPGLAMRNAMTAQTQMQGQAQNQASVNRQQEMLNAQGQLGGAIGNMRGQDIGLQNAYNQNAAGYRGMSQNAAAQNQAASMGKANGQTGVSTFNAGQTTKLINGIASGAGAAMTGGGGGAPQMKAQGGMIQKMASGGLALDSTAINAGPTNFAKYFGTDDSGMASSGAALGNAFKPMPGAPEAGGAGGSGPMSMAGSPAVPMMAGFAKGGMSMEKGGKVPGQATAPGNNYANDTVHALLSPKEIVIPRSITMAPDAPQKAAAFVQAILARNGGR